MNLKKRALLSVVAGLAAATVAFPGTALAVLPDQHEAGSDGHDFAFTGTAPSRVTIDYKPRKDKFAGRLSSDFEDTQGVLEDAADEASVCVTGRKVTVYKARRNRSDVKIGSDTVGSDGRWSVHKATVNGRYYATAGKSQTLLREYYGGIDYYVTCSADKSRVVRL